MKVLRTGIAATLVTMVCAIGLVVGPAASPAAAFAPSPVIVDTVDGVSLFGRFSNPVGWSLTLGAAAWWGYSHRDAIMSFLSPKKSLTDWGADPGGLFDPSLQHVCEGLACGTIVGFSTNTVTMKLDCVSGTNPQDQCASSSASLRALAVGQRGSAISGTDYDANEWAYCKNNATGAITNSKPSPGNIMYVGGANGAYGTTATAVMTICPSNTTAVGLSVVPHYTRQGYGLAYGRYSPGITFPPGDVKFGEADVTADCKNAATGETQSIVQHESLRAGTVVIPSCKDRLGDDWYGTGFTIAPTKPEIDNQPIPDTIHVPDQLPLKWNELIPDQNSPDWQPCFGTKKGCQLSLWIDNNPCDDQTPICKNWTKIATDNPPRVKCKYGTQTVDIKNCYQLAYAFDPGHQVTTDPSTTTPPSTGTDPGVASPGQGTTTDAPPAPTEAADQGSQSKCFPHGWSAFNPFEWVYKPMICVLKDAFIPSQSWSTWAGGLTGAFAGKAPFVWISQLSSLPSSIASGGCPTSWVFHFQGRSYPILCGTTAGDQLHSYRPLITVLALGAAVYPLLRSLVYSVIPIVRPEPSSGGDV